MGGYSAGEEHHAMDAREVARWRAQAEASAAMQDLVGENMPAITDVVARHDEQIDRLLAEVQIMGKRIAELEGKIQAEAIAMRLGAMLGKRRP